MATQYPPDLKNQALEILRDSGGDINLAHIKTGVPTRTLYNWRHDLWQSWRRHNESPILPNPPKPLPQFDDDLDALTFLRQQIMAELLNLANNFQTEMAYTTPAQRVSLLSQLTDRLIKLDEHLDVRQEEQIEYVYKYKVAHHVEKVNDPDYPDVDDDDE